MNREPRDYGREACYRAEQTAFGADRFNGAQFSPDDVRAAVVEIHRAHGDKGPLPTVQFPANRRGGAVAYPWRRLLCFPPRGTTLVVLCHELAHVYTGNEVGHGPAWRRCFVSLVANVIGAAEATALANAFAAERVSISAAAADGPVRKRETKPRRRWEFEARRLLSRASLTMVGNVTTFSGQVWTEWMPLAEAPLTVSEKDKRDAKKGYLLLRYVGTAQWEIRARAQVRGGGSR